jgi:CHASE1-domain containing sensor protein
VACLTAASIGVSSLWWQGLLPTNIIFISWLNWWIGDSLGAILIAPLIFCFAAQPRNLWSPRRVSVAIPMLLALLALSIVFALTYQTEKSRIQMEFDNQASSIDRLLVEYANHVIDTTEVFRDLYRASDEIDRREFAIFSKSILQRHAEIQAIEWLPRVTAQQLASFEKAVQAEGYPDFKVKEADANGQMQPVTPRAEYLPILFVEPMAENAKIFGLDSASQPISLASKQHALQTGKPSVTQRLTLAQRNDMQLAHRQN